MMETGNGKDARCEEMLSRLIELHMGELPDEEAIVLHQHLAQCEVCQAEDRALVKLAERLGRVPEIEPSEHLAAALRARLELERARGADRGAAPAGGVHWWERMKWVARRPVPLYGAAAAIVLVCAVLLGGVRLFAGGGEVVGEVPVSPVVPVEQPSLPQRSRPAGEEPPAARTMLTQEGVMFAPSPTVRLAFGLETVETDSI
ncbi:hypothetical protein AMJ39_08605 [candidate division TA06 bacterium DG_24]|uniref:Zinc-finger domain-containing protein n=2 Tax=Bacteria division TA06 TaxID=1156500 RepID=A0A0S7WPQ5_UNCT6|nr:MAG: hypothetical protein AMJ39_08605 [candidate division TA06 bacterium DG_24]